MSVERERGDGILMGGKLIQIREQKEIKNGACYR